MLVSDLLIVCEFACVASGVRKIAVQSSPGSPSFGVRMLKAVRQIPWFGKTTQLTAMPCGG